MEACSPSVNCSRSRSSSHSLIWSVIVGGRNGVWIGDTEKGQTRVIMHNINPLSLLRNTDGSRVSSDLSEHDRMSPRPQEVDNLTGERPLLPSGGRMVAMHRRAPFKKVAFTLMTYTQNILVCDPGLYLLSSDTVGYGLLYWLPGHLGNHHIWEAIQHFTEQSNQSNLKFWICGKQTPKTQLIHNHPSIDVYIPVYVYVCFYC